MTDQVQDILALARELSTPKEQLVTAGIYFLFRAGEVVYIGQSVSCRSRIMGHMYAGIIQFDAFTIIPIEGTRVRRLAIEREWLSALNPIYNRTPEKERRKLFVAAA